MEFINLSGIMKKSGQFMQENHKSYAVYDLMDIIIEFVHSDSVCLY